MAKMSGVGSPQGKKHSLKKIAKPPKTRSRDKVPYKG